jgi:hypothetical protein
MGTQPSLISMGLTHPAPRRAGKAYPTLLFAPVLGPNAPQFRRCEGAIDRAFGFCDGLELCRRLTSKLTQTTLTV